MTRQLRVHTRSWRLKEPFVISRGSQTTSKVVVVEIEEGGHVGRGEAVGVPYRGETLPGICGQIESVSARIQAGVDRAELQTLLPWGGARNALDCALWDLEARLTGVSVWNRVGIKAPRRIATTLTLGIRSLEAYEQRAREVASYPWLKVKVGAERSLEAVAAVRRGSPDARLVVDANQAWSVEQLIEIAPRLADLGVDLLEQPVRAEDDEALRGLRLPIPVCADEPVKTAADLPRIADRYQFVNIKLDKAGGLTAGLELAHAAQAQGLRLMVGCMVGSSLSMAPAMVLAQLCEVSDLDGPLLQAEDWPDAISYRDGVMDLPPPSLWGG
jgi:L-alanine-DL-glutamate epimerase-like enolase superfamily enzyme